MPCMNLVSAARMRQRGGTRARFCRDGFARFARPSGLHDLRPPRRAGCCGAEALARGSATGAHGRRGQQSTAATERLNATRRIATNDGDHLRNLQELAPGNGHQQPWLLPNYRPATCLTR